MTDFKFKKPKPTPQPCWTMDEVERIIAYSDGIAKICFEILAYTGMRIGELCHLQWNDLDFENKILHIRSKEITACDKSGRHVKIRWKPKNGEDRAVPIHSKLRKIFEALPQDSNWVVTRPAIDGKNPRQMSERWLYSQIKRIVKKLGLEGHLHTFRHSFVTHALVIKRTAIDIVREWVGHIDEKTIDNYKHISKNSSQKSMDTLFGDDDDEDNDENGSDAA